MRLFLLVPLAISQAIPETFNFFVSIPGVTGPVTIDKTIQFQWTYDTCAGALDANGQLVKKPVLKNGLCVDEQGRPTGTSDIKDIFPRGFSQFSLVKGFGTTIINLLPTIQNTPLLVAGTRNFTLANLNQYQSDYYQLSIAATDVNGNLVRGQSPVFIIQNTDPLPARNQIQLFSPLPGSYWVANVPYRIRFELQNTALADRFNLDLLTPSGQVIARLAEAAPALNKDYLLGTNRELYYLIWKVEPELANRAYKLRITGVKFDGDTISALPAPVLVESGLFYVGPAKPN